MKILFFKAGMFLKKAHESSCLKKVLVDFP